MDADKAIRTGAMTSVGVVSGIAAAVSFTHIMALTARYGASAPDVRLDSWLMPFSIDGTILASSLALLHESRKARQAPSVAYVMLSLGVLATLAANVVFGLQSGPVYAVISAWPAVAMIGGVEVLLRLIGREAAAATAMTVPPKTSKRREVARALLAANPRVSGATLGRAIGIDPQAGLKLKADLMESVNGSTQHEPS